MKKRVISGLITCLLALTLTACGADNANNAGGNVETTETATSKDGVSKLNNLAKGIDPNLELLSGKYTVEIDVKDYGVITLELDADNAPITVTNFMKLVNEGFYDGLTFHRIIDGFMMQGGDPTGTGMGGSSETIKGEFATNGIKNSLSHKRGVVSMARSQKKDSASSQFFICHQDSEYLDGQYAAFGIVIDGMDVVDAVCANAIVEDNNGTVKPENQPIINSIKEITK